MAGKTGIAWTDSTQNFWWGCTEVSPGCDACYAKTLSTRFGHNIWGPGAMRRTFNDNHWNAPYDWNRAAHREGKRRKVFTNSMADFFDAEVPQAWRDRAWDIMRDTEMLDWQVLTKRHARIRECLPADWGVGWPNVWLGVSAENQHWADVRVSALLMVPAVIHWVSVEPMIGPVSLNEFWPDLDWVIVGGESGNGARPMESQWARSLVNECVERGVAVFFKQIGDAADWKMPGAHHGGDLLDGRQWHEFPEVAVTQ